MEKKNINSINNLSQYEEFSKLNLSQEAIEDLLKSGLEVDIIKEAQIIPAYKTELDRYNIHYFDKNRRQWRFRPLYIIPYLKTFTDEGRFCRVKVKPDPLYPDFDGKYTQPPKQVLSNSCHLYILPSELKKLESPKCKIAFVEGEKKTLKLIQEIRKIEEDLDYKLAVIGISGVNNWQEAPEWTLFNLSGREVILFFDADSEHNFNVIKAELELAGFLYSQGVGTVKSAVWSISEGKGIDDFLVNAKDKASIKLLSLLNDRMFIFQKYKHRLQDKELLRAVFKYPIRSKIRLDYVINIVKEEARIKAGTINSVVASLKLEYEAELKEKFDKEIRKIFGTSDFNIPSDFLWDRGFITDLKGNILVKIFIVKEAIIDETGNQVGIVLKFADRKEVFIPVENLNKKHLTLIFNRNSIPMHEQLANKVLDYITLFQAINDIPKKKMIFSVGWIDEGLNGLVYLLPQVANGYKFDEDLVREFHNKGNKDEEIKLLTTIFEEGQHLALGYIFALSSLLIKPLNLSNFVIFNQGLTGAGKTTTNAVGLSVFGDYKRLKRNLNTTDTGFELLVANRKDTLILLDEVNTGKKDVAKQLIKFVYDFENAKGRTRANVSLRIREALTYRGILSITSEDALNTLLEQADKTVKGVLRRVVIVDYSEFDKVDRSIYSSIYKTLNSNYGNLIGDWINHIKTHLDDIISTYNFWIDELLNKFNFNGQERHLALLFTAADILFSLYPIANNSIYTILWKIAEHNYNLFAEAVELTKERVIHKLNEFVEQNMANFFNPSLSSSNPRVFFGKIDEEEVSRTVEEIEKKTIVYLTTTGIKEFAKYLSMPQKELLKLLVSYGILEKGKDRIAKKTTISLGGMVVNAYKIDTGQTIKFPNPSLNSQEQEEKGKGYSF